MTAPTDVTRVDAMAVPLIYALPALVPTWPDAASALGGMSRPATYKALKDGTFPVPPVIIAGRKLCRRADILAFLGLNDDATGTAIPVASVEPAPVSTATQQ